MPVKTLFFTVVLMLLMISVAFATSCKPMQEHYYFVCSNSQCTGAFVVHDEPAFGMCGRREEITEFGPGVADYLASLLHNSGRVERDGIYEILFSLPDWHYKYSGMLEDLRERFPRHIRSRLKDGQDITSISSLEVVKELDESYGPEWLNYFSSDSSEENVKSHRQAFTHRAQIQLVKSIAWLSAKWLGFALLFAMLIHSTHLFYQRLYLPNPASRRRFIFPVLMQIVVLCLSTVALVYSSIDMWPSFLLFPAVMVILCTEGWSAIRKKHA